MYILFLTEVSSNCPSGTLKKSTILKKQLLNDSSHESDFIFILFLELRRLWPLPFESNNFNGLQDKVTAVSSERRTAQRVSTDGTRVSR